MKNFIVLLFVALGVALASCSKTGHLVKAKLVDSSVSVTVNLLPDYVGDLRDTIMIRKVPSVMIWEQTYDTGEHIDPALRKYVKAEYKKAVFLPSTVFENN